MMLPDPQWLEAGQRQGLWSEADAFSVEDLLRCSGRLPPAGGADLPMDDGAVALAAGLATMFSALSEGSLCLPLTEASVTRRMPVSASEAEAPRWGERNRLWANRFIDSVLADNYPDLVGRSEGPWRPLVVWESGSDGVAYLYYEKYYRDAALLREAVVGRMRSGGGNGFEVAGYSVECLPEGGGTGTAALVPMEKLREALAEVTRRPAYRGGATLTPSPEQSAAMVLALLRRFAVVAGGPGTGKTTLIVSWLRMLTRLGYRPEDIVLTAPTGRAAQRMGEALAAMLSGVREPAEEDLALGSVAGVTLHRLLGYQPSRGTWLHHKDNPVPVRAVVVDEASMVDAGLFARLLGALPEDCRLLLVGDPNQLPSVEAGSVLADLIPGEGLSMRRPPDVEQAIRRLFRSEPAFLSWLDEDAAAAGSAPASDTPLAHCLARLSATHRAQGRLAQFIGAMQAVNADPGAAEAGDLLPGRRLFPEVSGQVATTWSAESVLVTAGWDGMPAEGALWLDASALSAGGTDPKPVGEGATEARVWRGGAGRGNEGMRSLWVWRGVAEAWWRRGCSGRVGDYLACLRAVEATEARGLAEDDPERLSRLDALFASLQERQILTMLRRGAWGCDDLNNRLAASLRKVLDPSAPPRETYGEGEGGPELFSGAPVLIVRNDSERGVYNGSIGIALRRADGERVVVFPRAREGRTGYAVYDVSSLAGYEWGFALTVHKSQGSEYGEVLLGIPPIAGGAGERMLTRELAYTGITRARRRAVVFSDRAALITTLSRRSERHSGMSWYE